MAAIGAAAFKPQLLCKYLADNLLYDRPGPNSAGPKPRPEGAVKKTFFTPLAAPGKQ